jgi:hypothetical protein
LARLKNAHIMEDIIDERISNAGTTDCTLGVSRWLMARLKPGDAAVSRIERRGQFQYLALEME